MANNNIAPFANLAVKQHFAFVLRIIEFVVLLASLVASYLHFKAAGKKITSVGRFHIAHMGYCGAFAFSKFIVALISGAFVKYLTDPRVQNDTVDVFGSACSLWYLPYDSFNIFLLLTMYLFFAYWDGVYSNTPKRRSRPRRIVYVALFLSWLICDIIEITSKPCTGESYWPLLITYKAFDLVFLIDSAWIFSRCFLASRQQLQQALKSRELTVAVRTVICFGALVLSYIVAVVLSCTEIVVGSKENGTFKLQYGGIRTLRLLFNLTFPSICVLVIMWKRQYFEMSSSSLSPLVWHSNPAVERNSEVSLQIMTSAFLEPEDPGDAPLKPLSEDEENDGDGIFLDDENDNDEIDDATENQSTEDYLAEVPKEDHRKIASGMVKGVRFIQPLTSSMFVPRERPTVEFTEDLRPPACVLPLLRAYLAAVIVPASEEALQVTTFRATQFMNAIETNSSDGGENVKCAANYERQRERDRIKQGCHTLISNVGEWVKVVKAMLDRVPTSAAESKSSGDAAAAGAFKSSAQKGNLAVAHLATNLQVHRTSVTWHEGVGVDTGDLGVDRELSVVTFGAPAAHALKFKSGGLLNMKAKLKALEEEAAVAATISPQKILSQLRLQAAVSCREGALVGQALGAAVASAIELLIGCLQERNEARLWQFAEAGLLLHSVCLLSTRGKENSMIEDFSGVYDMLNLSLRLEAPASATLSTQSKLQQRQPQQLPDGSAVRVSFKSIAKRGGTAAEGGDKTFSFGNIRVSLQVEPAEAFEWATRILRGGGGGDGRSSGGPAGVSTVGQPRDIAVVPVLFTLGVNEMQTLANAAGSTQLQTEVNRKGVEALLRYHGKLAALTLVPREVDDSSVGSEEGTAFSSPLLPDLLKRLGAAVEGESKDRDKDVSGVLLLSCHVARLMHGARTTSCKSAKDRTSVFHTLEVVRLSNPALVASGANKRGGGGGGGGSTLLGGKRGGVGESLSPVEKLALESLRDLQGVRLRNAELNVGRPKYAFNQIQLEALPQELRPPASTAGGGKS